MTRVTRVILKNSQLSSSTEEIINFPSFPPGLKSYSENGRLRVFENVTKVCNT
jgi:hypothetical protein